MTNISFVAVAKKMDSVIIIERKTLYLTQKE